MRFLWRLYSCCPSFCKFFFFCVFSLNILFLIYWVSLFLYLLNLWCFGCTFCFSVSVSCVTLHLSVFFSKICVSLLLRFPLSEPVPFSANIDLTFLQVLICFCILIFQKFPFLLFLHLLLGLFIASVIIVVTAYIKLFISVISDSLLLLLYYYYYIFLKNSLHFCVYQIQPQSFTLSPYLLIVDLLIV